MASANWISLLKNNLWPQPTFGELNFSLILKVHTIRRPFLTMALNLLLQREFFSQFDFCGSEEMITLLLSILSLAYTGIVRDIEI